jgi:hypothetical protein
MEFIRYNSLRSMADIVIDIPISEYRACGVNFHQDYTVDINPTQIAPHTKIFIKTVLLPSYLKLLSSIRVPFNLLTGSSDICPNIYKDLMQIILNLKNLSSWVGTNIIEEDPKILCIPIGFEESERERSFEIIPFSVKNKEKNKKIKILCPYISLTHNDRTDLIDYLTKARPEIFIQSNRLPFSEYLNQLSQANYVICPRGNGMDSMRIYETILAGAIPIIQKTDIWPMHRKFGIVIDSWSQLDSIPLPPLICPTNTMMLNLNTWRELISEHQLLFAKT